MSDLSKTDHAKQMAGIRARVQHAKRCVARGMLPADPDDS